MTMDRTLPVTRPPVKSHSDDGDPADAAPGTIANAAKAFLEVSRAAYEDCQHGQDALNEMHQRKNTSGE